MDRTEIAKTVQETLCRTLEVAPDEVTESANIAEDLGATSVDVVDLLNWLEERFELEIGDSEAQEMRTFGEVVDFVHERKSAT